MKNIINKRGGFVQIALMVVGIVIVVGAITWAIVSNNKNVSEKAMTEEKKTEGIMENEKASSTEGVMKKEEKVTSTGTSGQMEKKEGSEAMMGKKGEYKDYSVSAVSAAQVAGNKVVLFFHATWCPFCKTADSAFKSRIGDISSGITVLKTDYDSQTALKQKYGVTYQHTFVQIDTNGNQISKWSGGDIENLKKYVK